jgi:predicted glycoside hydrolase/deacetylase ChbG (UPF0249 family)
MQQRTRGLIVTADDFGQSDGVNGGIALAREKGIVTSASLMVRGSAAQWAGDYARSTGFDVGLHLDLGEWFFRAGEWRAVYEIVDLDDSRAVLDEVERQGDLFEELMGSTPTHVDTHQHVHRRPVVRAAVERLAQRFEVPARELDPRVAYCGAFYGQTAEGEALDEAITVEALLDLLGALPVGVTELGCHPGLDVELDTMYVTQRAIETATLCDARVRDKIDELGIQLCSFGDGA